jgi:hypothetical protein
MGKILAYLRTSTDKQDLNNQKLDILEYAHQHDLRVDAFVEITISSRKTSKQRRIDELLQILTDSDMLIVTELSRLGRSTTEVIDLINALVARNVRVINLKRYPLTFIPTWDAASEMREEVAELLLQYFGLDQQERDHCLRQYQRQCLGPFAISFETTFRFENFLVIFSEWRSPMEDKKIGHFRKSPAHTCVCAGNPNGVIHWPRSGGELRYRHVVLFIT